MQDTLTTDYVLSPQGFRLYVKNGLEASEHALNTQEKLWTYDSTNRINSCSRRQTGSIFPIYKMSLNLSQLIDRSRLPGN